jgi:hypothetical protein
MKSTHHGQQRLEDQNERLRTFCDPAFCRPAEENGKSGHGTTVAAIWHLSRCAISVAVPNVFVIRARA